MCVPVVFRRGHTIPWNCSYRCVCEPFYGCWELNPSTLEEQLMIWASEPSPQSFFFLLTWNTFFPLYGQKSDDRYTLYIWWIIKNQLHMVFELNFTDLNNDCHNHIEGSLLRLQAFTLVTAWFFFLNHLYHLQSFLCITGRTEAFKET